MSVITIRDIETYYGKTQILKRISLSVEEGQAVVLIGANGAGKTTTLKTISGLVRANNGEIELMGKRIENLPSESIVKMGIAHVPESRGVFPKMTVLENLELGACTRNDRDGVREDLERVFRYFPILKERVEQEAGTLSGGEQQMLAMGRGLMLRPKVYLLDEPSLGLAPLIVESLFGIIFDINKQGTTLLLVEQNARKALSLATRGYVIETGRIVLEGDPGQLAENEHVRKAYLGV